MRRRRRSCSRPSSALRGRAEVLVRVPNRIAGPIRVNLNLVQLLEVRTRESQPDSGRQCPAEAGRQAVRQRTRPRGGSGGSASSAPCRSATAASGRAGPRHGRCGTLIAAVSDVVQPRDRASVVGYRFWRDTGFVADALGSGATIVVFAGLPRSAAWPSSRLPGVTGAPRPGLNLASRAWSDRPLAPTSGRFVAGGSRHPLPRAARMSRPRSAAT